MKVSIPYRKIQAPRLNDLQCLNLRTGNSVTLKCEMQEGDVFEIYSGAESFVVQCIENDGGESRIRRMSTAEVMEALTNTSG